MDFSEKIMAGLMGFGEILPKQNYFSHLEIKICLPYFVMLFEKVPLKKVIVYHFLEV